MIAMLLSASVHSATELTVVPARDITVRTTSIAITMTVRENMTPRQTLRESGSWIPLSIPMGRSTTANSVSR